MPLTRTLFPLGRLLATPGALEALSEAKQGADVFIRKHQEGEWGDLSLEDKAANTLALVTGERILSKYQTGKGVKLWIITEADRSATTLLLPDEY
ncbi:MAG TPA: hypothetical protein VGP73_18550 [Thermoanaerobaculia bacterium]